MLISIAMLCCMVMPVAAADHSSYGTAVIGFSAGNIYYNPVGISGVNSNRDMNFGVHVIDTSVPAKTYRSLLTPGYTVTNNSGGSRNYEVRLSPAPFNNGLQGSSLTLYGQGMLSSTAGATNAPILMDGQSSVSVQMANGHSVRLFRSTSDPAHTATGTWGSNFTPDLNVYTHTVLAGNSYAVLTWELHIQ